jgi:sigma-54 specific flagellar transcriptional regulator A
MSQAAAQAAVGAATISHGVVHASSSPIIEIIRTCRRIAASDATVLLTGETGTGKEVFARLLHSHSGRTGRQFVPVNCGAIPENLLESELFGFVRGAFTGAISARRGRVALAEGGTLFLDEIGELPLSLQVKLLRLLQERTYEPVGSSDSVSANFRLIAATNRDLELEVKAGRFRRDLYYRLHVCPVGLPPLRERPEDVSALFNHFWSHRGEQRAVAPEVMRCLEGYSWPGNVRELENLVERLSVCSEGRVIRLADLPPMVRGETEITETRFIDQLERDALTAPVPSMMPPLPVVVAAPAPPAVVPVASVAVTPAPLPAPAMPGPVPAERVDEDSGVINVAELRDASAALAKGTVFDPSLPLPVDLPQLLRDLEMSYITKALLQTGGNKKEAAKLLGMGRTTLVEKLRRRNTDASGS